MRLNDFYYGEDEALVGATVEGNYDCAEYGGTNCCFCKPNGVRSSQVGRRMTVSSLTNSG